MSEIEKAIETLRKISDIETSKRYRELHEIKSFNYDLLTAIEALQEKLELENPQPLGLKELYKMGGEPVWCCYEKENHEIVTDCRLTSPGAFGCIGIDEKYLLYREYGSKWLAYRHKPDLVSVNKIEHIGEATNMVEGE